MRRSMSFLAPCLLVGTLLGADDGPQPDPPKAEGEGAVKKAPAGAAGKARRRPRRAQPRRGLDEPPPCAHVTAIARARRPAAGSMPELFARMGETFARNPAMGFPAFVQELSLYEGPAMEGITLSVAEERQAGRRAREEYLARAARRGFRVVDDPVRLGYLRALVAKFAPRMRNRDRYPNIEVTLIDAPISEGQSFPGGSLVFTTALLEEPDEATVAGVVAHELAHLDRGHLYEYARRGKLAETTFARPPGAGGSFDQFFTRGMALFGLMMNPYRPEHEHEADCTAVAWMYQEGYDPRALVGFFERLHRRTNDRPADDLFSFGRTHPFSLDRRRDVLDRLAQLRRWRPQVELGLFADNLRRRVVHGRELPVE